MLKKLLLLAVLVSVCAVSVLAAGCGKEKFTVEYNGQKSFFNGAKDEYYAGEKVTLYYDLIATDTDYTFYVDGESVNPGYDSKKGYIISFTMPDHDISVEVSHRNSMVYVDRYEMEPSRVVFVRVDSDWEAPEDEVSMQVYGCDLYRLSATIYNNTEDTITYGEDYELQFKSNGKYVDLKPIDEVVWNDIGYELEAGDEVDIEINTAAYGELVPGEYKLFKSPDLVAEFTICEEWTE